jgi:hypothetical protein
MKDEEIIKEISRDIFYEWRMLCWTFQNICIEIGDEVVGNTDEPFLSVKCFIGTCEEERKGSALLETFLLHVRNIRDFLYKDESKNDDVLAIHYFKNPEEWKMLRPPIGDYLNGIKERLNKALAHISYTRLEYRKNNKWNVIQIRNDLAKPWEVFLDALTAEQQKWFPEET